MNKKLCKLHKDLTMSIEDDDIDFETFETIMKNYFSEEQLK